jgi:hypothetical protein
VSTRPAREPAPSADPAACPSRATAAVRATGAAARALALQRAAGNRAAAAVLARWTKHPDPEQKGVMVPDSVADEFLRSNPPKNA